MMKKKHDFMIRFYLKDLAHTENIILLDIQEYRFDGDKMCLLRAKENLNELSKMCRQFKKLLSEIQTVRREEVKRISGGIALDFIASQLDADRVSEALVSGSLSNE